MKDYQEFPLAENLNGLFLIRNPLEFRIETLNKLHTLGINSDSYFSIEKLFKGKEAALLLYGPRVMTQLLPELNLMELEDYLDEARKNENPLPLNPNSNKTNLNESLSWMIESKNNQKKKLSVKREFFKLLELEPHQKVFWQIVVHPIKKNEGSNFQVTIRAMVAEPDPIKKIELAKKIDNEINSGTGLLKKAGDSSEQALFESFKRRSFVPKEISPFILSSEEVYSLMANS
jgi:hypothetical protein